MANYDFELVVKIGSMALIRAEDNAIDYNIFSRLAASLAPGMILVTSGATEIGRIDYMQRNGGRELKGNREQIMASYAAQGQPILMEMYRRFIRPEFSVRQILIEHSHFNDPVKEAHIRQLLFDATNQNAIPIINYNDAVSDTENRKWEIRDLRAHQEEVVECVDNDETAAVIARLVRARTLVILSSINGIYVEYDKPDTLIAEVTAPTIKEAEHRIDELIGCCSGASRIGANGAAAKLEFAKAAIRNGTRVIIANAKERLEDILEGSAPRTYLAVEQKVSMPGSQTVFR